jgi:hypothetical protein
MASKALETAARLRKQHAKKDLSISIKIQESDLYDWYPTARYLLIVIEGLQVRNEDAYFPEDCPEEYYNDRVGWCWMSQAKLALRVGISEPQVCRWIKRFKNDGVIKVRTWQDDNNADHDLYQIVESVVEANQRPSQKWDVERPSRYKKKRGANKGSFSASNQPRRVSDEIAEMDEE